MKFSTFLRDRMKEVGTAMPLPEEGLVYDYQIQDGGLFSTKEKKGGDDDDDEKNKGKVKVCVRTCVWIHTYVNAYAHTQM